MQIGHMSHLRAFGFGLRSRCLVMVHLVFASRSEQHGCYLLYCFSGSKLIRWERFVAYGDGAAMLKALQSRGKRADELWERTRKVHSFTPAEHQ
jgi:hypothetical protein